MTCIPAGDGDAGLEQCRRLPVQFTGHVEAYVIAGIVVRAVRRAVCDRQVQKQDLVGIRAAERILRAAIFHCQPCLVLGGIKPCLDLGKQGLGPLRHVGGRVLLVQEVAEDIARDDQVALAKADIGHQHLGKLRPRIDKKHPLERRGRTVKIAGRHLLLEQGEVEFKVRRIVEDQVDQVARAGVRNGRRRCQCRCRLNAAGRQRHLQCAPRGLRHFHGGSGIGETGQAGTLFGRGLRKLADHVGKRGIAADAAGAPGRTRSDGGCLDHHPIEHRIRHDDAVKVGPARQHRHRPLGFESGGRIPILTFDDVEKGHRRDGDVATAKLQLRRQHRGDLVLRRHLSDPGQRPLRVVERLVGKLATHGGVGQFEICGVRRCHRRLARPVRKRGVRLRAGTACAHPDGHRAKQRQNAPANRPG